MLLVRLSSAALLPFALLTGCAGSLPDPPSLLPRAVEKLSLEEPASVPRAPLPGLPGAIDRAAALVAQARDAVAAAERARPRARVVAEHGSDRWIEAQMTASAAEAALVPARGALGACEALVADAVAGGLDTKRLAAARDEIAALVSGQQARLEAVSPR